MAPRITAEQCDLILRTGAMQVRVVNVGGAGAETAGDGIKIIDGQGFKESRPNSRKEGGAGRLRPAGIRGSRC